jgi:hypothetical protein
MPRCNRHTHGRTSDDGRWWAVLQRVTQWRPRQMDGRLSCQSPERRVPHGVIVFPQGHTGSTLRVCGQEQRSSPLQLLAGVGVGVGVGDQVRRTQRPTSNAAHCTAQPERRSAGRTPHPITFQLRFLHTVYTDTLHLAPPPPLPLCFLSSWPTESTLRQLTLRLVSVALRLA